ncbi:PREDICTED: 4-coumarate--CoA ligase 4-like [Priapulus caudatus]|uniref:4-coumarate--CoA ligase 4-like n=1 Tax=Priapulus caudatus TaxID=37621 RepID=A0ABM1DQQ9_PRICU|nr:PREDICTED: 4-coumarate--CoA ligase 4-like [Priapulus caudatus]
MSESGLVVAEPSDHTKIGTVGQPLSNVECKVIDVETGVEVPAGGSGELLIRSPSIMLGYVNDPVSTANCMDSDGWLHSGDIVRYDEEGFVYVKDRIRDTMKVMRDGVITIYVSPSEVESVILSHPGVADTTVLGIHDEVLAYDLLRAFVVAREGVTVTAEEIKEHVKRNARLPEHCLTSGVTFLAEIPRTGSGKALRRVLRQTATET